MNSIDDGTPQIRASLGEYFDPIGDGLLLVDSQHRPPTENSSVASTSHITRKPAHFDDHDNNEKRGITCAPSRSTWQNR